MEDAHPPPKQSEATAPERRRERHPYDAPNLSAKQFLMAVMRDPTVNLYTRMKAADRLCHIVLIERDYVPGEWSKGEPVLKYKIEGFKQ